MFHSVWNPTTSPTSGPDRPPMPSGAAFDHALKFCGKERAEKICGSEIGDVGFGN